MQQKNTAKPELNEQNIHSNVVSLNQSRLKYYTYCCMWSTCAKVSHCSEALVMSVTLMFSRENDYSWQSSLVALNRYSIMVISGLSSQQCCQKLKIMRLTCHWEKQAFKSTSFQPCKMYCLHCSCYFPGCHVQFNSELIAKIIVPINHLYPKHEIKIRLKSYPSKYLELCNTPEWRSSLH